MKNKSILLTLGILGTLLLVAALVIAHGNQNQERINMKGRSGMMAGMMRNSEDEMHGGMMSGNGMMGMMHEMMGSGEMKKMHTAMIEELRDGLDDLEDEERQEMQEMIKHMESCPMMK